jgi:hypothetical protein
VASWVHSLTVGRRAPTHVQSARTLEAARSAQAIAGLLAKGDLAAARAEVLARFASCRTAEAPEAFVSALGRGDLNRGWVALERLMDSEVGCLRAHNPRRRLHALQRGPRGCL